MVNLRETVLNWIRIPTFSGNSNTRSERIAQEVLGSEGQEKADVRHTSIEIQHEAPVDSSKKPTARLPRPEAKVWDLYLDLAEREATDRAHLWNTALDSLLIFAGLFAGVVSSFVIDARTDLQPDSEQRLLNSILEITVTQSRSFPAVLDIPIAAFWISALWIVSLCTTIFSAVMGVLAKAWLAKYVARSRRRRADDAFRRYKADIVALRWHDKVALILPFLVQFASLLFVLALIIQLHGDSPTIGRILLTCTILGLVVYTVLTFLPLVFPLSPASTPLSDILAALFPGDPGGGDPPIPIAMDEVSVAFAILCKLISSDKAEAIDEAIAEIVEIVLPLEFFSARREPMPGPFGTMPSSSFERLNTLAQTEMPGALLWRMRYYATTNMDDTARRQEVLCTHLQLFIAFADVYELLFRRMGSTADPRKYQMLEYALCESFKLRSPLHRWDGLPEPCRALSFRLRSQIIVLFPTLESAFMTGSLEEEELKQHAWKLVQIATSSNRIHAAVASCHLLVGGQNAALKNTGTLTLSLLLGKGGVDICLSDKDKHRTDILLAALQSSETGCGSLWAKPLAQEELQEANDLALQYLRHLHETAGWAEMATDTLRRLLRVEAPLGDADKDVVLGSLVRSLQLPNHALRIYAIKMLKHVVSLENPALLSGLADTSLKAIADVVFSGDQDVREDGFFLLTEIASKANAGGYDVVLTAPSLIDWPADEMAQSIRTALGNSIHSSFSKNEEPSQIAAAQVIEKVAAQGLSGPLASVVVNAIPELTEVALDESNSDRIRRVTMKLLQTLWCNGFSEVKTGIIQHWGRLLKGDQFSPNSCLKFLSRLQRLFNAKDFSQIDERFPPTFPWLTPSEFVQETVTKLFGQLVNAAIHRDELAVYGAAQELLTSVARDDRFYNIKPNAVKWLRAVAKLRSSEGRQTRFNTVHVANVFAKHLPTSNELLEILLRFALRDGDGDIRFTALKIASTLLQSTPEAGTLAGKYAGTIKDIIVNGPDSPGMTIIANEPHRYVSDYWSTFLVDIAKHGGFCLSAPLLLMMEVKLKLRSWNSLHQTDLRKVPSNLHCPWPSEFQHGSPDPALHEALKNSIVENIHLSIHSAESTANLIKALAELFKIETTRGLAAQWLSYLKDVAQTWIEGDLDKPAYGGPGGAGRAHGWRCFGSPEYDSFLERNLLLRVLGQLRRDEALHFADMICTLASIFPKEFPAVSEIILALASCDHDSHVRSGLLRCLGLLAKTDPTRPGLIDGVVANIDQFAQDSDWNMRLVLIQALVAILAATEGGLPEEACQKLVEMATKDRDYDVRSESIKSLIAIVSNADKYPEAAKLALEKVDNDSDFRDRHWLPRQSWVMLVASQIKYDRKAVPGRVTRVMKTAIGDENSAVRSKALEALQDLLKDGDGPGPQANFQNSLASQLGKCVSSFLQDLDLRASTLLVLNKLTLPTCKADNTQASDAQLAGHKAWSQIIDLLGRNGEFQGVAKLVELAFKETSPDRFNNLNKFFLEVKLQEPIQSALPRYIELALTVDPTITGSTDSDIRASAIELVGHLASITNDGTGYRELFGATSMSASLSPNIGEILSTHDFADDAQIVSRLADIAVKADDTGLRSSALDLLKSLFQGTTRFPDLIKFSLSKLVETCFKVPELTKFRPNAISVLHSLTEPNANKDFERFGDLVSPSIPHLLKMTMLATDKEDESLRKEAEEILLMNLAVNPNETKLNRDVFSAITEMIPRITVQGKSVILQLGETLQLEDDTVASIAHDIAPLLRSRSSFTRSTAVELLSRLYSAHRSSQPRLIESAIPEIIALAFDEKEDNGEIRVTAIQLLVALSAAPKVTAHRNSTTASSMNSSVVKHITPLATRFMDLLQNENLRLSVVELLSLMASEPTVRHTISLQIVSVAFGEGNIALLGHTELLARLISDGRFAEEPTDKVMLLFASAMMTRPELARYRFEISTALWCRYRTTSVEPNVLVNLFTLALFGQHATVLEVRTWLRRCKSRRLEENTPRNGLHRDEVEHAVLRSRPTVSVKAPSVNSTGRPSVLQELEQGERIEPAEAAKEETLSSKHFLVIPNRKREEEVG
ncbi:hypothetical protein NMY22_g10796 [Coprinellus aureogranulatus]|nr:hypothetical protein NMY22_g10796 [Coprinellus aureogranulatus]